MKKNIILCLVLLSNIFACKENPKTESSIDVNPDYPIIKLSSNRENLNISVLMDLSDRINPKKFPSPAMDFYLRDIGYLKSIAQSLELHLLNKKTIRIDDKIQAFIDPEPFDTTLNRKLEELKISFTKNDATKNKILLTSKKYDSISNLIYESAIKDDYYIGSDTWKFFKNKVSDYCLEAGYRNILVILTDGYIYHKDTKIKEGNRTTYLTPQDIRRDALNKSKWMEKFDKKDFGFIKIHQDLSNLEVLVLGVNPDDKNPYEEDVIVGYWTKWLKEMNVKNFEIKQADLPSNMDKIIRSFILKE